MKLFFGLLLIGLTSAACSQQNNEPDLGNPPGDLSARSDSGAAIDLGTPGDLTTLPVTGTTLNLVAGALGGSGNIDGVARAARFSAPAGLALDGAGNLYVADYLSYTIRKIVLATGAVSTFAGTPGQNGPSDGTGAAANFNLPSGLTTDNAGNLYVADFGNLAVRKIVLATGAVSTFLRGGVSGINLPSGVATDGAGNLYVADSGYNQITQFSLATMMSSNSFGQITAGSADGIGSAARFRAPQGVAADGAGNLYVADTGNSTLRKIVLATGAVTTLVGIAGAPGSSDGTGAEAQFNYPQGIAADGAGNLYVADTANHTIRKVVVATATVTTIAGLVGMPGSADGPGLAARFYYPSAVALNSAGNLYIADRNNSVVRQIVLATGMVSTIAGTAPMSSGVDGASATARFNMPAGAASDSAGNLYIADTGNSTIRQVVLATGAVSTLAGTAGLPGSTSGAGAAARFRNPEGVATDGTGNLYVADTGNSLIRKVVVATGAVSTLAGASSMQGSTDGIGGAARFNNPETVATDGTGNLYVADTANHLIRKVVLTTGAVSTLAGTAGLQGSADGIGTAAQFRSPKGIAADGMGNLYIADTNNYILRKIVLATGAVSTVAGGASMPGNADGTGATARFRLPRGLAVDGLGNLYICDTGNATIRRFTPANASVITLAGKAKAMGVVLGPLPGGLNQPTAVTVTLTGELIIADSGENAVLAVR